MIYHEWPPPESLAGFVKLIWALEGSGTADASIEHRATPDGCIELIHRRSGRSRWDGDQPACFAVGLIERPAGFAFSGDAAFVGVRLWPWSWAMLGAGPVAALADGWAAVDGALAAAMQGWRDAAAARESITRLLPPPPAATGALAAAILAGMAPGDIGRATRLSPRRLQRWFAHHVGLPPRRYLRLLRFQRAFEEVGSRPPLAAHAAAHGFADQAHMARDFRALAGTTATEAGRTATGPFLPG